MFGNASIWFAKKYGTWVTVHNTGSRIYQENSKTGKRRTIPGHLPISGGYQIFNQRWIDGGEWEPQMRPPAPSPITTCMKPPPSK